MAGFQLSINGRFWVSTEDVVLGIRFWLQELMRDACPGSTESLNQRMLLPIFLGHGAVHGR